ATGAAGLAWRKRETREARRAKTLAPGSPASGVAWTAGATSRAQQRMVAGFTILRLSISISPHNMDYRTEFNEKRVVIALVSSERKTGAGPASPARTGRVYSRGHGEKNGKTKRRDDGTS